MEVLLSYFFRVSSSAEQKNRSVFTFIEGFSQVKCFKKFVFLFVRDNYAIKALRQELVNLSRY